MRKSGDPRDETDMSSTPPVKNRLAFSVRSVFTSDFVVVGVTAAPPAVCMMRLLLFMLLIEVRVGVGGIALSAALRLLWIILFLVLRLKTEFSLGFDFLPGDSML